MKYGNKNFKINHFGQQEMTTSLESIGKCKLHIY